MIATSTLELFTVCRRFVSGVVLTLDAQGHPCVNNLLPVEIDGGGSLWFPVQRPSEVAQRIANDPRVYLRIRGASGRVALSGRADVITNRSEIFTHWSEKWRHNFPGGPWESHLWLVRVRAAEGEFWNHAAELVARSAMVYRPL